jgi:3-isopropylmalate dehydratase small subunit
VFKGDPFYTAEDANLVLPKYWNGSAVTWSTNAPGVIDLSTGKIDGVKLLANPGAEIEIDLEAQQVRLPNGQSASFTIESFARYCLLNGVDELGFLLSKEADIARYEARRPA